MYVAEFIFSINILVACASRIAGMPCTVDAWDVWYRDLGYINGGKHRTYACKFCNKGIAYRASRLHRHLGYEGGVNDVAYCIRMPLQVQRLFAANEGRIIPSYP
jgi:hypothetical protein